MLSSESESQMNIADSHVKAEEQPNFPALIPYPILAPNPSQLAIADAYDSIPCNSFLEKQAYKRHQIFFRPVEYVLDPKVLNSEYCQTKIQHEPSLSFASRCNTLGMHNARCSCHSKVPKSDRAIE